MGEGGVRREGGREGGKEHVYIDRDWTNSIGVESRLFFPGFSFLFPVSETREGGREGGRDG